MENEQTTFRREWHTHIHVEKFDRTKNRDGGKTNIDIYRLAFDSMDRLVVWKCLGRKLVQVIQSKYSIGKGKVQITEERSNDFVWRIGIKQSVLYYLLW